MAKKTIHQLIDDMYDDDDVKATVLQSAIDNHTVERIEAGELVLPGTHDARAFHLRTIGTTESQLTDKAKEERIAQLEAKVAALTGGAK